MDKRYLKSYEQFLPKEKVRQQIPLRELTEAGVCICGSSDSPVQSMNPYEQMLGMVEFYLPGQSLTPFQALRTYTAEPARMLGEEMEAERWRWERRRISLSQERISAGRSRRKSGSFTRNIW